MSRTAGSAEAPEDEGAVGAGGRADEAGPPLLREPPPPTLVLMVIPGSQFVIKVAAFCRYKRIPVRFQYVRSPSEELAAPRTVPVLRWGDTMVADSACILEFLDSKVVPDLAYPSAEARELDAHLGGPVNALVQYMNMFDASGFELSVARAVRQKVPAVLRYLLPCKFGPRAVVRSFGVEGKYRANIERHWGTDFDDERMRALLRGELQKLEDMLGHGGPGQLWLLGTPSPSAPDFALYGLLEHLVGDSGYDLGACYPEIFDAGGPFPRLERFFGRCKERFGITFSNDFRVPRGANFLPPVEDQLRMRPARGEPGFLDA